MTGVVYDTANDVEGKIYCTSGTTLIGPDTLYLRQDMKEPDINNWQPCKKRYRTNWPRKLLFNKKNRCTKRIKTHTICIENEDRESMDRTINKYHTGCIVSV